MAFQPHPVMEIKGVLLVLGLTRLNSSESSTGPWLLMAVRPCKRNCESSFCVHPQVDFLCNFESNHEEKNVMFERILLLLNFVIRSESNGGNTHPLRRS